MSRHIRLSDRQKKLLSFLKYAEKVQYQPENTFQLTAIFYLNRSSSLPAYSDTRPNYFGVLSSKDLIYDLHTLYEHGYFLSKFSRAINSYLLTTVKTAKRSFRPSKSLTLLLKMQPSNLLELAQNVHGRLSCNIPRVSSISDSATVEQKSERIPMK